MDEDEADVVVESLRERKLTAKAWELKVESLQRDRKSKVNKIKNLIGSMKDLMQNGENASKVYSLLKTLKLLRDDVTSLHESVIPLLPVEEQTKQNEWYGSVSRFNKGFIEDVEKWLLDLEFFKKTMSAPAIAALSEQMNECLVLPQSDTVATQMKTMSAAENSSSLHDQLPAVIASDCANPKRTLTQSEECNALPSDHFTDDIKPTDSISNTCSKNSGKRSSSSGSRSGRSSTSSARLQVEAEMAALLARQQMLQRKHEVEEEEERLRKKKEQIDLQTKIAVSMAKVNVYRAAISEPSVHLEKSESRKKSDQMSSSNVMATASVQANAPVESRSVSNSTRDVDVRSTQPHSVQQPSSSSITPFQLSASFSGQQFSNRGGDVPVLRQSLSDDEQGNMVRLMERQNEIAAMLVQQCNTSLLPHRDILPFDGDPLQYQSFIRSFEEVVEKRANNYGDCFYFLEHYTRGQPRELVRSCQHMASTQGYLKAKALLKAHFGNELKISSAYMDKVLSWKAIRSEDTRALQDYHLFLRACCNAMDDVCYMKELNLATNMQTILSKLPFKLRDKWRAVACELQEKRNTQAVFKDIVDFVEKQVKIATDPVFGNILEAPLSVNRNAYRSKMKGSSFSTTVTVTGTEDAKEINKQSVACLCCGDEHFLNSCTVLAKRSHKEKLEFLKKQKVCFGCLGIGHISRDCKKRITCRVCGFKHPSILHVFRQDKTVEPKQAIGNALISVQSNSLTGAGGDACALSILPVCVKAKNGTKIVETYAFLDPGSSSTFCTESLMEKLNLSGKKLNILLKTMNQDKLTSSYVLKDLEVAGLDQTHYCYLPEVYTQKSMPVSKANIPTQSDLARWPYLNHVTLPLIEAGVELLIGANVPEALEPWQVVRGQRNGPYAVKTILGWTVNGPLKGMEKDGTFCNDLPQVTVNRISVSKLDELWKQQFRTDFPETAQDELVAMSKEDIQFMDMVSQSVKLRDDYTAFMEDVISKGYAEKVPERELKRHDGRVWYIPHHGVYHPKKKKIRVVFDCSASFQGESLNGHLLQGPDLTSTLIGVLTRFRMEPVALMADIESMFYQVKVPAEDSDLLRFLWWSKGDLSKDLEEFRMVVHLFGASSSPRCSNYALKKCADDHGAMFNQRTVEVVQNHFYVDDCLFSVPTESDAIQLYKELKAMCAKGGFHLTKWMSNSRVVLNVIPEEDRVKEVKNLDLNHDMLPVERVLGVQWCAESDTFKFKIVVKERPFTRRGILSVISAIYDPLGFLAPVVLSAKRILQDLCREGQCMPVRNFVRLEAAPTPCDCQVWHQSTAIAIREQPADSVGAVFSERLQEL
ncbi:Cold shock protein 1 [Labeo rohita]|uniref:Cold shock protein 1 n=1 Tax=Labeo rohita TaxID=84645 RepID=A0ABQ8L4Q4_LABRO|nr:Cold shock protein 1 [Labeo rohita]